MFSEQTSPTNATLEKRPLRLIGRNNRKTNMTVSYDFKPYSVKNRFADLPRAYNQSTSIDFDKLKTARKTRLSPIKNRLLNETISGGTL
jgi:hypothetical protein